MRVLGLLGAAGSGKDTVARFIQGADPAVAKISFADPIKLFCQEVFDFTHDQLWGPSEARNAPDLRYKDLAQREQALTNFWQRAPYWLDDILPKEIKSRATVARASMLLLDWFLGVLRRDDVTPRYALQGLGTQWGRNVYSSIWIDYALNKAQQRVAEGASLAVITDVRFINEARVISDLGGAVWRIVRPSLDTSAVTAAGIAKHASEEEQKSKEIEEYIDLDIINDSTLEDLRKKVEVLLRR